MTTRTSYTIPLSELSSSSVILPGGLHANPKLHYDRAGGVLRIEHDATPAAVAAYDAMRRTRLALDETLTAPGGRLGVIGSGNNARSMTGGDQDSGAIARFLKNRLDPADWEKLQQMIAGGNGESEDQGGPGNPEDDDLVHRREEEELERRTAMGQDSAAREGFLKRYPTAGRLKSWASF